MKKVQLAGLENALEIPLFPRRQDLVGKEFKIRSFQNPEALVGGPVGKPSDMFSFGALVRRDYVAVEKTSG